MAETLNELRGKLQERRRKLNAVFDEMGPENDLSKVTLLDGVDDLAKSEQIKALNDEMGDLRGQIDQLEGLGRMRDDLNAMNEPVQGVGIHPTGGGRPKETKTIGELFTEHAAFHRVSEGQMGPDAEFNDIDMKATLFQTGTGWAPPTIRSSMIAPFPVRKLVVADLLQTIPVQLPTYLYMEENTFVNSAVEVAEAAVKSEVGLNLVQRTENIRKIAGYLPVTDEQLDDVPAARAYIDNRMGYMIRQRLDTQILHGNGSGVNIAGINRATRSTIQTHATSSDTNEVAVRKAITLIEINAFADPNAVVMHPSNWETIRLSRAVDSGIYLFGPPSQGGDETIFGLRVVSTTAATAGTATVGDWNQAALLLREGLTMKVGYVNDDLIKNKQTIVAELRAGIAVFRPVAFCEVTGLA